MFKIFSVTAAALLLCSCQGATTSRPVVSQSELKQEQMNQERMSYNGNPKSVGQMVAITPAMGNKFTKVSTRIGVAGEDLCQQLQKSKCHFDFTLEQDKVLNAYADGDKIVVSSAMAQFANEDQLAMVIAHEFGHNIMNHVGTQKQNAMVGGLLGSVVDMAAGSKGIDTGGMFGGIGQEQAVLQYSVSFEEEADYVGLYIMRRAGYDISKAPELWRKMSAADASGIYSHTTHPSNPERFVALNKTIAEIKGKQQAHQPLVPNFGGNSVAGL